MTRHTLILRVADLLFDDILRNMKRMLAERFRAH
jgi:hypothetical protein